MAPYVYIPPKIMSFIEVFHKKQIVPIELGYSKYTKTKQGM